MKIWVDHALTEDTAKYLGADGWPLGTGLFETVRTENSRPQLLSRHMRRVLLSSRELSISLPSEEQILDAVDALLSTQVFPVGRLRLSFSVDNFVAVHEPYLVHKEAITVSIHRTSGSSSVRQHKAFPYTEHLNLLATAIAEGVDEFICVDQLGRVTEGAVSNLALRVGGSWITPPITSGILPGVIRALAVERCDVFVHEISEGDLLECDGAIAMSSLKVALPVSSIDSRRIEIDSNTEQICSKLCELARTL